MYQNIIISIALRVNLFQQEDLKLKKKTTRVVRYIYIHYLRKNNFLCSKKNYFVWLTPIRTAIIVSNQGVPQQERCLRLIVASSTGPRRHISRVTKICGHYTFFFFQKLDSSEQSFDFFTFVCRDKRAALRFYICNFSKMSRWDGHYMTIYIHKYLSRGILIFLFS